VFLHISFKQLEFPANFLQYYRLIHTFADNLPLFYQFLLFYSQFLITIQLILPSKGSKDTHKLQSK